MAWKNAPVLNKLAASQLGGKRGAQIWGVDFKGKLYTVSQKTAGGGWSDWLTNGWAEKGYPEQIYELCASPQFEGQAQLWVLDMKRRLWTIQQGPTGDWLGWRGPGWNNLPNNVEFKKMAVTRLEGIRSARFWGINDNGMLISCDQASPPGNWTAWQDWPLTPSDTSKNPPVVPAKWVEVTACLQGDGKGAMWALDTNMQLWGMGQAARGGAWGAWVGPNWLSAPKLRNIAAVEMGRPQGACIWGITDDYKLVYNQQTAPGGGWWGWRQGSNKDELRGYEITAAGHNSGRARVWVVSCDQVLVSQGQLPESAGFEGYWTPEV